MMRFLSRIGFCLPSILLFLSLLLAAGPAPAAAQSGGTSAQSGDSARSGTADPELARLIARIEDPAERQKLLEELRLLEQADKTEHETEERGLLPLVSEQIAEISNVVLATAASLADVGHFAQWARQQISDPALRASWAEILVKLACVFASGFAAEHVVAFLLRRPERILSRRQPAVWLGRLLPLLAIWLLKIVPIAAFLFVAQSLRAVPELQLRGSASDAAVLVVTAYAMSRLALVTELALLMPAATGLRPVPLEDETANYLFIWARRLTLTGVWGYFIAQALRMLGLPRTGFSFSLKMVGLLVATLLIILVLQNRQAVAQWIRSQKDRRNIGNTLKGLCNRLADIWHVLAVLYILALFLIWALQVNGGLEYVLQASVLTGVILVAANLLSGFMARQVVRAFSLSEDVKNRFPGLETRANRYLVVLQNVLQGVLTLVTVLALAQAWGVDVLDWMGSDTGRGLLSGIVSIGAVLLGALIVWELVNSAIERHLSRTDDSGAFVERRARVRTLLPLARNAVLVVLVVVVVLIVMSELGVNIAPLLAGAGVVGVAIGFGSQKLVQDVITGAFILFEDTISVGDIVQIGDYSGVVEGMTIRTIRLRNLSGSVHTLPFSSVTNITNMTREFAFHVFDVGVAYREDIGQVIDAIKQVGEDLRADPNLGSFILEPIEVFGVEKLDDSAVVVRGRIKTLPAKQWEAGRNFNRRIKDRFDELGIEIPFPHTTLYFGVDKDGNAPAANIRSIGGRKEEDKPPAGS